MRGKATVLAVLAAIIIMVIMLPRLRHRQEEQLQNLCESRLGRLAKALRLYLDRYDNLLPPAPTWCEALEEFVPPSQRPFIFHCPKLEGRKGYGFAMNFYAWDEEHRSPRWHPEMYPAEKVVLFYETKQAKRNAVGRGDDIPEPGRHNGANLVLFANGSTMPLTPEEMKEMEERGELLFKPLPRPPTPLPRR